MDGFKDSTRMKYMTGGSTKAEAKMGKVMGEFASGKLHSGSKKGPEVKNPKQAVAIAMSEARKAGAKMPVKKAMGGAMQAPVKKAYGGVMDEDISSRPTDSSGRRASNADLGITPGGQSPKKPVGPSSVAVSKVLAAMAKKGVPAYSGKPMVRRSKGGLMAMPKGKC